VAPESSNVVFCPAPFKLKDCDFAPKLKYHIWVPACIYCIYIVVCIYLLKEHDLHVLMAQPKSWWWARSGCFAICLGRGPGSSPKYEQSKARTTYMCCDVADLHDLRLHQI
jgi:hypothetical protein